jgi:glycosyltransferase involved in cell wall biosynthesis
MSVAAPIKTGFEQRTANPRVLQVLTSACEGGLSRYLLNLLPNLQRCETHLACTHFEGPHYDEMRGMVRSATVLRAHGTAAKLARLTALMRRLRPHAVHAHQEPVALLAARLAGVPRRMETIHLARYWKTDGRPQLRAAAWACATDHIVYTRAELELIAGLVPNDKVRVVPPGYDLGRKVDYCRRDEMPGDVPIPADAFVVGSVGRLAEQKGYRYLIEAAPTIRGANPNVWFLLVGDGPERDQLERRASELGVADRLVITGYQQDAVRFLKCMDVFAFPSLWESWGFSAVEAMAAGLPIVSADTVGPTSFLENEKTALIVPKEDAVGLASAINRLGGDPDLRRRLGKAALTSVGERHSMKQFVRSYERLYGVPEE